MRCVYFDCSQGASAELMLGALVAAQDGAHAGVAPVVYRLPCGVRVRCAHAAVDQVVGRCVEYEFPEGLSPDEELTHAEFEEFAHAAVPDGAAAELLVRMGGALGVAIEQSRPSARRVFRSVHGVTRRMAAVLAALAIRLAALGVERVYYSPVNAGGARDGAQPSPAVLRLAGQGGVRVYMTPGAGELLTLDGAAVLAALGECASPALPPDGGGMGLEGERRMYALLGEWAPESDARPKRCADAAANAGDTSAARSVRGGDGENGRPVVSATDGLTGENGMPAVSSTDGLTGENGRPAVSAVDGLTGENGRPAVSATDGLTGENGMPAVVDKARDGGSMIPGVGSARSCGNASADVYNARSGGSACAAAIADDAFVSHGQNEPSADDVSVCADGNNTESGSVAGADDGNLPVHAGQVALIECNIDDMSPEQLAYACQLLMERGALDVWQTPIIMKKGRMAAQLSVLCAEDALERLAQEVLRQTSTLGVRIAHYERRVLPRSQRTVDTRFGQVRVKLAPGKAAPEYEDCRAAAQRSGAPIGEVYAAARRAIDEQK